MKPNKQIEFMAVLAVDKVLVLKIKKKKQMEKLVTSTEKLTLLEEYTLN